MSASESPFSQMKFLKKSFLKKVDNFVFQVKGKNEKLDKKYKGEKYENNKSAERLFIR